MFQLLERYEKSLTKCCIVNNVLSRVFVNFSFDAVRTNRENDQVY